MRRYYIDNIRWMTGLLVVIYHVIYMYNGVTKVGVIGPFSELQYQDAIQYLLYPWFMVILFIVSGMSSRYYLENHSIRQFVRDKTRKLLVPSTIGLFVFQWIQGYFNMKISAAFMTMPDTMPKIVLYLIIVLSGTGVLWYLQMLWLFSMILAVFQKNEKGKIYQLCKKVNVWWFIALVIPLWFAAQIGNTPIIAVYRFGIYGFSFLLGYFLFCQDKVVDRLCPYWQVLSVTSLILGGIYTYCYFGENFAVEPVVNAPLAILYGWITILAIFAVMKKWCDRQTSVTAWFTRKSFGLYVFHYLPLSVVAYLLDCYAKMPTSLVYLFSGIAAYAGGYLLFEIISRVPLLRWCVLGIKKEKNNVS